MACSLPIGVPTWWVVVCSHETLLIPAQRRTTKQCDSREGSRPARSAKCGHITGHSQLNPATLWGTYTTLAVDCARARAGWETPPWSPPQPTHLEPGAAGSPSPVLAFPGLFLSLISDISGGQNALGPFRTSCVALIAPLLNVLGVDSLGVRFELASESSKAYPSSAPGDIVGLSGCFAPHRQSPGESKPGIFARPPGSL